MKKIFVATLSFVLWFGTAQAQTATTQPSEPAMTKEQKQEAKDKKERDLKDAFAAAGYTKEEEAKTRELLTAYSEKAKSVKSQADISDEEKKQQLDAVYKARNEAMKTVVSKEKYKLFKDTQKAQKEIGKAD